MGNGSGFKCSKCGETYSIHEGIGMLFPDVLADLIGDIRLGKYGDDLKDVIGTDECIVPDAEKHVYCCSECGYWSVEPGVSLYRVERGKNSVNRAMKILRGEDCVLIKEYIHRCEKCGGRMHKAKPVEKNNLPCPYCGGARDMNYERVIMWD